MLQFSRRPARHHAATTLIAFVARLAALRTNPGRAAARAGLTLALALVTAVSTVALVGCGSDDDAGVVDAGRDGGTLTACKPSDCPGAMPTMHTCSAGTATFTCARNIDLRCAWLNPRCTVGNDTPDAVGTTDGPKDAGAEDASVVDAAEDAGD
jgi:hypothetical protein